MQYKWKYVANNGLLYYDVKNNINIQWKETAITFTALPKNELKEFHCH